MYLVQFLNGILEEHISLVPQCSHVSSGGNEFSPDRDQSQASHCRGCRIHGRLRLPSIQRRAAGEAMDAIVTHGLVSGSRRWEALLDQDVATGSGTIHSSGSTDHGAHLSIRASGSVIAPQDSPRSTFACPARLSRRDSAHRTP